MSQVKFATLRGLKKTENGNVSGYTAAGVRVHIYKAAMAQFIDPKSEELVLPAKLFALVDWNKTIKPKKDADGNQPADSLRPTATFVSASKQEVEDALGEDIIGDREIMHNIAAKASALGLNVNELAGV